MSVQDLESESDNQESRAQGQEGGIEAEKSTSQPKEEPGFEMDPEPPELVDGQEHAVDPASIIVQRLEGMMLALGVGGAVLIGLTIAWARGGIPFWLFSLLLVPVIGMELLQWQWPVLRYRHLRYRVDSKGIQIRRGVLWRQAISIPTTRVQHTDITQGPLQRHWNLATLTVHTAGTQGASISLAGLHHTVALRLRDHLLPIERRAA